MKSVFQKISYQIRPYPTASKKTWKTAFGLQIIINGSPRMIPIEPRYFRDQFDPIKEQFRHNDREPEIIRDLNLCIGKEKARANDIITRYRLSNTILTHRQFRWEFGNYVSKENVHDWLIARADKAFSDEQVSKRTRLRYTSRFKAFKAFHPEILPFHSLSKDLIIKFDKYLRKHYAYNTVVCIHKTMRKFFTIAVKEGHLNQTPYSSEIRNKFVPGTRNALTPQDLEKLISLFSIKNQLTGKMLTTLEMFVFSATSGGYRFSELTILNSRHVKNGVLNMDTIKGENFGVQLSVNLPDIGLQIIGDRKGKIFEPISEPTANKSLKMLASMAGINSDISFHSARDTFGTLYTYYGGDVVTLSKEIFKHSKLETTMIYQKKSDEMKKQEMKIFNVFKLPGIDPAT